MIDIERVYKDNVITCAKLLRNCVVECGYGISDEHEPNFAQHFEGSRDRSVATLGHVNNLVVALVSVSDEELEQGLEYLMTKIGGLG